MLSGFDGTGLSSVFANNVGLFTFRLCGERFGNHSPIPGVVVIHLHRHVAVVSRLVGCHNGSIVLS